jgi:predicted thioesterase
MLGESRVSVGPGNVISFADDRMPAVLATPWLVAHLEYAARDALAPCLEDHERSVGTIIEVEHLAPVPEGLTLICQARVILVDGLLVTFQVEASDGVELVARGLHRRRVIDVDRFARRVAQKKSRAGSCRPSA